MNKCHSSCLIIHTCIDFRFERHAQNRHQVRRLITGCSLAKWYIHLN